MDMTWSFVSMLSPLVMAIAAAGCASRYGQVEANLQSMAQYGVSYVSGGASEAGMDAMLAIADRFNVRLTMVDAAHGDPVPDAAIVVASQDGRSILQATANGPMFYLRLPTGAYRLAIGYQGWVQTRDIAVDGQALDMTFRLPAKMLEDDWLLCSTVRGHVAVTAVW